MFRRHAPLIASVLALALTAGCGAAASRPADGLAGAAAAGAAGGFDALGLPQHRPHRGPQTLIVEPDMGVAPILQAIGSARHTLAMEMYMMTNTATSEQVVQALIARQKAGVNVTVMLEAHPYLPPQAPACAPQTVNPNSATIKELYAGGVNVQYANPRFRFTHEKAMIIDNKTAYIMTMNMTSAAFTSNREFAVVDTDPADVAEINRIFQADWNGQPFTPADPNLVVSPDNARKRLLALIDSAQKSILLQTEVFTDAEIASHLQARVKAGVDATVVMAFQAPSPCDKQADLNTQETQLMQGAGVTKFVFTHSVTMHAKTLVVDGNRAYVGSENLSANSLDNNREMGILLTDPAAVGTITQIALKDYAAK